MVAERGRKIEELQPSDQALHPDFLDSRNFKIFSSNLLSAGRTLEGCGRWSRSGGGRFRICKAKSNARTAKNMEHKGQSRPESGLDFR